MGYRTVVILNNDASGEWQDDPQLGRRIQHDQFYSERRRDREHGLGRVGEVVECCHTSGTHLIVVDYLRGHDISYPAVDATTGKLEGSGLDPEMVLRLLKTAAGQLGYNLTRKRKNGAK